MEAMSRWGRGVLVGSVLAACGGSLALELADHAEQAEAGPLVEAADGVARPPEPDGRVREPLDDAASPLDAEALDAGHDAAADEPDELADAAACPGPSGTLDETFGDGGGALVVVPGNLPLLSAAALTVQHDGKVVIAGIDSRRYTPVYMRFLANGSREPFFGGLGAPNGCGTGCVYGPGGLGGDTGSRMLPGISLRAVVETPEQRLVAAGHGPGGGQRDFMVQGMELDGGRAPMFLDGGPITYVGFDGGLYADSGVLGSDDYAQVFTFMANGQMVLAGTTERARSWGDVPGPSEPRRFAVARLLPEGRLDPAFAVNGRAELPLGGPGVTMSAVVLEGTGAMLLLGGDTLMRVGATGALDSSFGDAGAVPVPSTALPPQEVLASTLLRDVQGRILASRGVITRFLPNGSVDVAFGQGGTSPVRGTAFAVDKSGRALVWTPSGAVRLSPSGQLDPTYTPMAVRARPIGTSAIVAGCSLTLVSGMFVQRYRL